MNDVFVPFQSRRFGWWPLAVMGLAIGALVIASAIVALCAASELHDVRNNGGDSVARSVAKLELELSTLQRLVAGAAQDDTADAQAELAQAHATYVRHLEMMLASEMYRDVLAEVGTLTEVSHLAEIAAALAPLHQGVMPADAQSAADLSAALERSHELLAAVVADVAFRISQRETAQRQSVLDLLRSLTLFPFLLMALLAGLGTVTYRLFHILRQRSDQARQTLERLRTIVSTSRDAIAVTDADGRLVEFNAAAEALFGYPRAVALGQTITVLLSDVGPRAEDGVFRGSGLRADGRSVPLELTAGHGGDGALGVTVYVMRDISHRLATEEDLRDSYDRALAGERAKARFLAVMSHEMRTPLHGILGAISLLRAETDDPVVRRYVGVLEGSGEILLSHINDVLDISRIESQGIPIAAAPVDLDALSAGLIRGLEPLARLRDITLLRRIHFPGGAQVISDPARLRQIMLNLIDNALKHTGIGEVALDLSLSGDAGDPVLEIQVTDTGPGIAADQTERIFEDFVRLNEADNLQVEGSGLGLGITRRIVQAMGGEIGVDSEPGAGSLFWVQIPVRRAEAAAPAMVQTAAAVPRLAAPASPMSVLVIEDNAVNRLILREMLLKDGHRVDEAMNGAMGVAAADATAYDVILLDISMPVMDGVAAARRIRQGGGRSARARIVALTAHVAATDDTGLRDAGIDRVATKPLTWDELRALLRGDVVDQPAPRRAEVFLDHAVFASVVAAIGATDFGPHLRRFMQDGDALVSRLRAGATPDIAAVHALAGAAATLGARRLHRCLCSIEEAGIDPQRQADLVAVWAETLPGLTAAAAMAGVAAVGQTGT